MPIRIAHRGYSGKYGDNNIQSFKKAFEYGFDMIELDVQLCSTGEIVVYHDIYCNNHLINKMSLDEVNKNGIITLNEVFDHITPDMIDIFLDIKGELDISTALYTLLTSRFSIDTLKHVYVSSFNRLIMDNIQSLVTSNFPVKIGFTTSNSYLPKHCGILFHNVDFVCLEMSILNQSFINQIKDMDKRVFTYTCNDKTSFNHMLTFNVDGIVSNFHDTDLV